MHGRDEDGASLVEYALLLALISVVAIGALQLVGSNASDKFDATQRGIATGGLSYGKINGTCDAAGCTLTVPDHNPNYVYTWLLPNGHSVVQDCSSSICGSVNWYGPGGGQIQVHGYWPGHDGTYSAAMVCDNPNYLGWSCT